MRHYFIGKKRMYYVCRISFFSCLSIFLLQLGGCNTTPRFYAQVIAFHQPDFVQPHTPVNFAFIREKPQEQSLEQRAVEEQVALQLNQYYLMESPRKTAKYLVAVSWSIDEGKLNTRIEPSWGNQGWYTIPRPMYGSNGQLIGYMPMFTPGYSIQGYQTYTELIYTRQLHVDIYDRREYDAGHFAKKYEATAIHQDTTHDFFTTAPWLAQALFKNFPAENGQTQTVQINASSIQPQ